MPTAYDYIGTAHVNASCGEARVKIVKGRMEAKTPITANDVTTLKWARDNMKQAQADLDDAIRQLEENPDA